MVVLIMIKDDEPSDAVVEIRTWYVFYEQWSPHRPRTFDHFGRTYNFNLPHAAPCVSFTILDFLLERVDDFSSLSESRRHERFKCRE
jgi:hypothetical protein